MKSYFLVAIIVGVFVAGIGIGYAILVNSYNPYTSIMNNPQMFNQMMYQNPQFMQSMMLDPQFRQQWLNSMSQNPQLRQQWFEGMMGNQQFMQNWMGNTQFQNSWMYPYMQNTWRMGPSMMYNTTGGSYGMGPGMMGGSYGGGPGMTGGTVQPFNWSQNLGNPVQTDQVLIPSGAWDVNSGSHYLPYYIQVNSGTTVTWTNKDSVAHTVTSTSKLFDSGLIQPGQSFSYDFKTAGEYDYYCVLHPWMKGSVRVS